MELDLQNAHIGISLAINIFDEFFVELHKNDPNLQMVDFGLTLEISALRFLYVEDTNSTVLQIIGMLGTVALDIRIHLSLVLKEVPDSLPVLGLQYEGVASIEGDVNPALETLITDQITLLFEDTTEGVGKRIDEVQIDLITEAINGLEAIVFPDPDTRPPQEEWNTHLQILPAADAETMPAVAVFIAPPGIDATTAVASSFLNALTGFGLVFNQQFVQELMTAGAEEQIGTSQCGAELEALTLDLQSDRILVEGRVQKSLIELPFDGPAFPFLYRGTTEMSLDTSQIDADEPPGFVGFLKFLVVLTAIFLPLVGGAIFGFLGLLGGIIGDIWAVPAFWGASEDLENADETIQGGLAGALGNALEAMATGLLISEEIEMITLESTPNTLRLINGHFVFDALVFVSPVEQPITNGWYSKKAGRFMFHQLEGGQKFKTSELARLVKSGKITTPGFHAVEGANNRLFMRADPDNQDANNLVQMFRENTPDEPYLIQSNSDEEDDDDC